MSFKEKKYQIIKNAISSELAQFCYKYFILKAKVFKTMLEKKTVSPYIDFMGTFNDPQVPNSYAHYGDIAMETLLTDMQKKMQDETNLNLVPTYSYARIYYNGNILKRHKDRPSCEISTTMNLGGDPWPIYLEPNKNVGIPGENGCTFESTNPGIKVDLNPGDMLVYSGCTLEHWRECVQVFLHYNNIETQGEVNKYDTRPHLGLPSSFKQ